MYVIQQQRKEHIIDHDKKINICAKIRHTKKKDSHNRPSMEGARVGHRLWKELEWGTDESKGQHFKRA